MATFSKAISEKYNITPRGFCECAKCTKLGKPLHVKYIEKRLKEYMADRDRCIQTIRRLFTEAAPIEEILRIEEMIGAYEMCVAEFAQHCKKDEPYVSCRVNTDFRTYESMWFCEAERTITPANYRLIAEKEELRLKRVERAVEYGLI